MKLQLRFAVVILALCALLYIPVFATSAPTIISASVDSAITQLTISGSGFSPSNTTPIVVLGATTLTLRSFSNTQIVAALPANEPAGSYSMSVTESAGGNKTSTFEVTIGNQGPVGPIGPQGAQGLIGPQGPQGIQGTTGSQGEQGPAGISNLYTTSTVGNSLSVPAGNYFVTANIQVTLTARQNLSGGVGVTLTCSLSDNSGVFSTSIQDTIDFAQNANINQRVFLIVQGSISTNITNVFSVSCSPSNSPNEDPVSADITSIQFQALQLGNINQQ